MGEDQFKKLRLGYVESSPWTLKFPGYDEETMLENVTPSLT